MITFPKGTIMRYLPLKEFIQPVHVHRDYTFDGKSVLRSERGLVPPLLPDLSMSPRISGHNNEELFWYL